MKTVWMILTSLVSLAMIASVGIAAEKGNVERGKALFNDASFAGGMKACSACHPDGKGLAQVAAKKELQAENALEKRVNACIVRAIKGKAIDPNSAQMADIIAYIRSIK